MRTRMGVAESISVIFWSRFRWYQDSLRPRARKTSCILQPPDKSMVCDASHPARYDRPSRKPLLQLHCALADRRVGGMGGFGGQGEDQAFQHQQFIRRRTAQL